MIDWNIQSRSHHCQKCEKAFTDKQSYHTVLCDGKHEYQRLDVCDACWKETSGADSTGKAGFISHWHGVYEVPPAAPPEAIQKENAETLLRKLMEQNDPQYHTACYILAVMLERKRILKVKAQSREGGQRVFVYEHPKTGDIFTIADPDLQLDQLEAVQRQVGELLEHGLNPAAPAATEAGASVVEVPATDAPAAETPVVEAATPAPEVAPTPDASLAAQS